MTETRHRTAIAHDPGKGGLQNLIAAGPARFVADQPIELGGLDLGPTPHEIVAAALAACTAQTLRVYAQRKAWPLDAVDVQVTSVTDRAAVPVERFERRIVLGGDLDETQRARLLEIAESCPIHRLLTNGAGISTAPGDVA